MQILFFDSTKIRRYRQVDRQIELPINCRQTDRQSPNQLYSKFNQYISAQNLKPTDKNIIHVGTLLGQNTKEYISVFILYLNMQDKITGKYPNQPLQFPVTDEGAQYLHLSK